MLRRVFLASLAAVSVAIGAPHAALSQAIFLSGGAAFSSSFELTDPTETVEPDIDTGWLAAGGLVFDIGEGGLWAGIEGSYGQSNGPDQNGLSDITLSPWGLMGFLGYSFPTTGSIDPYVFGGAGLSGVKIEITEDGDLFDESASGFGYEFGGGISFGSETSKIRPYVEGRYMSMSGDVDLPDDPTVDVDNNIIGALLGVVINVGS